MRAKDGTARDQALDRIVGGTGCPLRDGPLGAGIVLSLRGAELPDDVDRRAKRRPDEPLPRETLANDVADGQFDDLEPDAG